MEDFEYIFELFTLLIGLAVAEMLLGFSGVLKLRARRKAGIDPAAQRVRVGWLVPLLGLFVLVDLATFWLFIYELSDSLTFNLASVLAVLLLIGGYYLLATLVFPDEPGLWPDFDTYYWLQKRIVLLGAVAINLLAQLGMYLVEPPREVTPDMLAHYPLVVAASLLNLTVIPLLVWCAFSKRPRVNLVLLGYVVATQLFYAVATVDAPTGF